MALFLYSLFTLKFSVEKEKIGDLLLFAASSLLKKIRRFVVRSESKILPGIQIHLLIKEYL